jgi:YD repeat-containing protein
MSRLFLLICAFVGVGALALPGVASAQSVAGYDRYGRLKCVKYPSGKVTKYDYDNAGNRTAVTTTSTGTCVSDAGGTTAPTVPSGSVTLTALNPSSTTTSATTVNQAVALLGTASDSATLSIISATASGSAGSCGTSSYSASVLTFIAPSVTSPNTLSCTVAYTLKHPNGQQTTGQSSFTINGSSGGGSGGGGGTNGAPTAVADTLDIVAMQPSGWVPTGTIDPRANDTDPDSDVLTITAKTNGTYGSVAIQGGGTSVTYTRNSGVTPPFTGSDSFTYTISDGHGHTSTATVSVNIEVTSCTINPQTGMCEIE